MKHFKGSDNMVHTTFEKLDKEGNNIISLALLALNKNVYFPFFVSPVDRPAYIYRASRYYPLDGNYTKKDVQYPSIEFAKLNRCNFETQPIFYAANTVDGALSEISESYNEKTIKPEVLYISRWEIIEPFYLVDFYYKDLYKGINQKLYEHIVKINERINSESPNPEKDRNLLRICGNRFTVKGKKAYPFTSILSNLVYGQYINDVLIQGITYVGVKKDTYSNIALLPELINNNKVILKDVVKISIWGKNDINIISATKTTNEINDKIELIDFEKLKESRVSEIHKDFC